MPSLANIVINDGKGTPVAHTFKPRSVDNGQAIFKEDANTPLEQNVLTVSLRDPAQKGAPYRGRITLMTPHVVTSAEGVKTVEHKESFALDFSSNDTSTAAEMKDIRVLFSNLLLNAAVAEVIDQRTPYYGA